MSDEKVNESRTLLVVDDSKVSRMMICAFFKKRCPQWQLLEAASGTEAVALATQSRPDFATMDVNMPGISGFDAAEQLLAINPAMRVVMLTANIQESSRALANNLQVGFVAKPATEPALEKALSYLVASC